MSAAQAFMVQYTAGEASQDADQDLSWVNVQQQLAELKFSLLATEQHNSTLRQERRATHKGRECLQVSLGCNCPVHNSCELLYTHLQGCA